MIYSFIRFGCNLDMEVFIFHSQPLPAVDVKKYTAALSCTVEASHEIRLHSLRFVCTVNSLRVSVCFCSNVAIDTPLLDSPGFNCKIK